MTTLVQTMSAASYRASRVVLCAWMKTENALAAQLWLRIDEGLAVVALDNMSDRPIGGSTEWTQYRLVLDVPERADGLAFGVMLRGAGRVWVDDFVLARVSADDEASTGLLVGTVWRSVADSRGPERLGRAYNLDFEQ